MTNTKYLDQITWATVKGTDVMLIPGFEYLLIVPRTGKKTSKYFDVLNLEANEAVVTKVDEFNAKKFVAAFVECKVEELAQIAAEEKAWADAVAADDAVEEHYASLQLALL